MSSRSKELFELVKKNCNGILSALEIVVSADHLIAFDKRVIFFNKG